MAVGGISGTRAVCARGCFCPLGPQGANPPALGAAALFELVNDFLVALLGVAAAGVLAPSSASSRFFNAATITVRLAPASNKTRPILTNEAERSISPESLAFGLSPLHTLSAS